jgi:hypothetical protein
MGLQILEKDYMSKQRRFETELEIRLAIAKKRRSLRRALQNADDMDIIVKNNIKESNNPKLTEGERQYWLDGANDYKKKAHKQRRSAQMIEENQIPALIRTLADYRTETFAFMPDKAVTMAP